MNKTNLKSVTLLLILVFFFNACSEEKAEKNVAVLEYDIEAKLGEGAFWNHLTQEFY